MKISAGLLSALLILSSFRESSSSPRRQQQSPSEERFSYFDSELFQVLNQKEDVNFIISPISVKLVLGMLIEGATGKTGEEIRAALRLPNDKDSGRKEFETWMSLLQARDATKSLKIANRLFVSTRHSINTDYETTLKKYYAAGVTNVHFENPKETADIINNWVNNQTSHLISTIIRENQIDSKAVMMLTSAVHFKGLWKTPFTMDRSIVKCFYTKQGVCSSVDMMTDTGYYNYGYISKLDAQAIQLPYQGGKFSMLMILPSKGSEGGVNQLARDLLHVSLKSIMSEMREQEVFVKIPKFDITYNEDLVETLMSLQITRIFGQNPELSKILTTTKEPTSINHVLHSARITVDEEGTEAGAATGGLFVPLMGGTTTSFIADRPFLFFVTDSAKNNILFAGRIVSPDYSKKSDRAPTTPNGQPGKTAQANQTPSPADMIPSSSPVGVESQASLSTHRLHSSGPKFRSIKTTFPLPSASQPSANEREDNLLKYPPFRKGSSSHEGLFRGPSPPSLSYDQYSSVSRGDKAKKRGRMPLDGKAAKRQEGSSEDWRHHILLFT